MKFDPIHKVWKSLSKEMEIVLLNPMELDNTIMFVSLSQVSKNENWKRFWIPWNVYQLSMKYLRSTFFIFLDYWHKIIGVQKHIANFSWLRVLCKSNILWILVFHYAFDNTWHMRVIFFLSLILTTRNWKWLEGLGNLTSWEKMREIVAFNTTIYIVAISFEQICVCS